MPIVCAHGGCGKRLLRKDGAPDYHRHFCGSQCKNADKRERMQEKRRQAKAVPVRCAVMEMDLSPRIAVGRVTSRAETFI
jgi:hypothetical protein